MSIDDAASVRSFASTALSVARSVRKRGSVSVSVPRRKKHDVEVQVELGDEVYTDLAQREQSLAYTAFAFRRAFSAISSAALNDDVHRRLCRGHSMQCL